MDKIAFLVFPDWMKTRRKNASFDGTSNIGAYMLMDVAQRTGRPQEYVCAIGDELVGGIPYAEIVRTAREYITRIGSFENFAAWGLIR